MFTTPQEAKRSLVENLFVEYLKEERICLKPGNILSCVEVESEVSTSFSFYEGEMHKEYKNVIGKSFVECVFTKCKEHFQHQYDSMKQIKMSQVYWKPPFSMKKGKKKASFSAVFSINKRVQDQEFFVQKDSMLLSGLQCVLNAFEFYVNCDKTHKRLKFLVNNAEQRQRGDLAIKYKYDIAHLTEVSWYAE